MFLSSQAQARKKLIIAKSVRGCDSTLLANTVLLAARVRVAEARRWLLEGGRCRGREAMAERGRPERSERAGPSNWVGSGSLYVLAPARPVA